MCITFNAALAHTHARTVRTVMQRVQSIYIVCISIYTLHMCLDMFVAFFAEIILQHFEIAVQKKLL